MFYTEESIEVVEGTQDISGSIRWGIFVPRLCAPRLDHTPPDRPAGRPHQGWFNKGKVALVSRKPQITFPGKYCSLVLKAWFSLLQPCY